MIETIYVGATANDGTGDPLRDAMIIINNNFLEIESDYMLITGTLSISQVTGLQTVLTNIQTELNNIPLLEQDIVDINIIIGSINSTLNNQNLSILELQSDLMALQILVDTKIGEAPIDGNEYVRKDGGWVQVTGGSSGVESVSGDGVDNTDPLNPVITWPTPGDIGAESSLGFTPEDVSNKATDFTTINNTLYPSVQAVEDRIDLIPIVDDNVFLTHYPVGSIITLNNYTSIISSVAFSTTTTNSNNLTRFQPFVTNKAITIDELYLSISAGNNGASSTVTFYVFDDSNDGLPGVKLHQEISAVGVLNVTNTILTFATNVVLQPGVYWIGIHIRDLNTGGANPTFNFASLGGNTKGYQTAAITYTNNFQGVLGVAATVGDLTDNPTILVSTSTALLVPMLKIKLG